MRLASRAAAAALAATIGLAGAPFAPAAVHAAPAGDGRGATHVFETPLPPGAPGEAVASLTFDDGPHPTYTPQILDVLASRGVKATFFVLGREAERHPDLVRRIVAEGHVVANHTWDHPDLRTLDETAFGQQVDRTNEVLESLTGHRQTCLRPPYGRANAAVLERLAARGMTSVAWTADSRDFEKPGAGAIATNALEALQPGAVILLHDGGGKREQTIEALPAIIDGVRAAGYRLAPVCAADPHIPAGALAAVEPGPGRIRVAGWAADPDSPDPIEVQLSLDGVTATTATTRASSGPTDPGPRYEASLRARPGPHEVCAHAVNVGPGGSNPTLGCISTEVGPLSPFDDLRPLAAKARFAQLVAQAEVVRSVVLAHRTRRLPWTLHEGTVVAQALLAP